MPVTTFPADVAMPPGKSAPYVLAYPVPPSRGDYLAAKERLALTPPVSVHPQLEWTDAWHQAQGTRPADLALVAVYEAYGDDSADYAASLLTRPDHLELSADESFWLTRWNDYLVYNPAPVDEPADEDEPTA